MGAAADDQIAARLLVTGDEFRDLRRKVLAVRIEGDHAVVALTAGPREAGLEAGAFAAIHVMHEHVCACSGPSSCTLAGGPAMSMQ